jgi:S-adenosylmethionine synthetase
VEIALEVLAEPPLDARPVEVVERKGLGHPDRICDALAEELSLELARRSLERHGAIVHHNVDKALLWAGRSQPRFGGGEVLEPIEIYLAGRAAADDPASPVAEWAGAVARRWLAASLRSLDPERHVRVHALVRPAAADLADLYARGASARAPLANDTSCGVGFAPLSVLERVVLGVERHLTSDAVRDAHPAFGEDVKVMGTRRDAHLRLTVACALVDRHLAGPEDALAARAALEARARERAEALAGRPVEVEVNVADDPRRGRFYLTVTGTSAESGDDGQAGRGNRVNGLITPCRPMTLESVAGKNPLAHVGKLYNLCAGLVAQDVVEALPAVAEAECRLVSQIGRPVDDPWLAELRLRARAPLGPAERARAREVARAGIEAVPGLWRELLAGRLALDRWPLRGGAAP